VASSAVFQRNGPGSGAEGHAHCAPIARKTRLLNPSLLPHAPFAAPSPTIFAFPNFSRTPRVLPFGQYRSDRLWNVDSADRPLSANFHPCPKPARIDSRVGCRFGRQKQASRPHSTSLFSPTFATSDGRLCYYSYVIYLDIYVTGPPGSRIDLQDLQITPSHTKCTEDRTWPTGPPHILLCHRPVNLEA
jgi:hypothetical protein